MERGIEARRERAVVRGGAAGDRGGAGRGVLVCGRAQSEHAAAGPALLPPLGGQRADRTLELLSDFAHSEPVHQFNTGVPETRLRAELRTIAAPTLVVAGEDDYPGAVCGEAIVREFPTGAWSRSRAQATSSSRAARAFRAALTSSCCERGGGGRAARRASGDPADRHRLRPLRPARARGLLYELKGRDRSKPVALLATDVDALVAAVPGLDSGVLERYLPGRTRLSSGNRHSAFVCPRCRNPRPRSSARSASSSRPVRTSPAGLIRGASRTSRIDPLRVRCDRRRRRAAGHTVDGGRPDRH